MPKAVESKPLATPPAPGAMVDIADAEKLAAELSTPPQTATVGVIRATDVKAGTPANPKSLPLFSGKVRAYALVRSDDGMWRSVSYTIEGNVVTEIRTKEPDMKAILAAQITDALALDMPLFNDEEGPRE